MEGRDHPQKYRRASNSAQKVKEATSTDEVKCLRKVDEGKVKGTSLFSAFLLELSYREHGVNC